MNIKNKRPIFVPAEYQAEIEALSKAALMDTVWDMATQLTPSDEPKDIMSLVRAAMYVVTTNRKSIKPRITP